MSLNVRTKNTQIHYISHCNIILNDHNFKHQILERFPNKNLCITYEYLLLSVKKKSTPPKDMFDIGL